MNVVLISTYELGHQPFGLASPAAWLKATGAVVTCVDLEVESLRISAVIKADLVAFYVPMHTATRLTIIVIKQVQSLNPQAHLCCYGLYAPLNEIVLRNLGVHTILGGEFEAGLVMLIARLQTKNTFSPVARRHELSISLGDQDFHVPDRRSLPSLSHYACVQLVDGTRRVSGYTEASRGCQHHCRHCPIVSVYHGQFRIIQRDVVLADINHQVDAGARHITFGDPDFLNGPKHAIALVQALHMGFPDLSYDVTIKIAHLLRYESLLSTLRDTGCLFITSAVVSINDAILYTLDKGHTKADFLQVVYLFRTLGMTLNPTFIPFTPWTSCEDYYELLAYLANLNLIEHVAPIQYTIRLLIPAHSKVLHIPDAQQVVGAFDETNLCYPWVHPDPGMDQLQVDVLQTVKEGLERDDSRWTIFNAVFKLADAMMTATGKMKYSPLISPYYLAPRVPIPFMNEPWCC